MKMLDSNATETSDKRVLCVEEGGPFLVVVPFFLDWGATAFPGVVEMPVVEDPTAP